MSRRVGADAGSATVEIALLLPLVLVVLFAVAEVAMAARVQIELVNGAREGARVAAVSPEPADAVAAVQRALGELAAEARIGVSRPHVVGEPATVTVVLRHRIGSVLLGGSSIELQARATMRVEK